MEHLKNINITISSGTIIKSILFVLLIGALFFLKDLVLIVMTAIVIASAIEPITKWFISYKIPRVIAVLLIYVGFILLFLSVFYFSVQKKGIDNFLRIVTPVRYQKYILDLWNRSQTKIGLWMQGQLILAVVVGMLVYIGLTIFDIRYALLLAALAGIFELIPLFGAVLAAIPAIIIAFIDGGITLGLLITGLYLIIQQFENHLIYPLVVTKVVGVPPLLVILALIIGAQFAGFLGIILSVPIAAIIQELIKDIQREKEISLEKHSHEEHIDNIQ